MATITDTITARYVAENLNPVIFDSHLELTDGCDGTTIDSVTIIFSPGPISEPIVLFVHAGSSPMQHGFDLRRRVNLINLAEKICAEIVLAFAEFGPETTVQFLSSVWAVWMHAKVEALTTLCSHMRAVQAMLAPAPRANDSDKG